ncbi:methionine aminotransferase [Flavobacterium pallidum]|uniref:Methionine aminotransferase n=1 Tax=Flavobacterium pallidum TaxID=2172098 RepID=A0A2S1SFV3_9FLAO|nr:methionine aminotransferase [Flavobacterium pallidum]AWI25251.1 methionine aminotransferase [Flavobacterium pallidum]
MKNIKSKLPYVTHHIFSEMSALATRYNAINLSQGFPNFEPSQELLDLVGICLNDKSMPLVNQYAPIAGLPFLREKIAEKVHSSYGIEVDWDKEVTITVGATEGISATISAFVWPGEEVILIEPCYDSYKPAVDTVGGKTVIYTMKSPDFKIDWDEFAKLITAKTRMICISTPNNPTGTIMQEEDMLKLSQLVHGTDIIIMSDEVYEHMVFDGKTHESPLKYDALRERTVSVFSFGKTYHITGWKVGYCIAAPELTVEIRKVHQNSVFSVSHPLQKALAKYMDISDDHLKLPEFYQKKRDLFSEAVKGSRFKLLPCAGSYFQLFDYSDISNENDYDFCVRLIQEHGVAAIPVSRLYTDFKDDHLIRLCFAKTDETLLKAAALLKEV